MKKKVNYKGVDYNITFQEYGYSSSQFIVNGAISSIYMENTKITDMDSFKRYAIASIEEYIERHKAAETFKNWDGKL